MKDYLDIQDLLYKMVPDYDTACECIQTLRNDYGLDGRIQPSYRGWEIYVSRNHMVVLNDPDELRTILKNRYISKRVYSWLYVNSTTDGYERLSREEHAELFPDMSDLTEEEEKMLLQIMRSDMYDFYNHNLLDLDDYDEGDRPSISDGYGDSGEGGWQL